MSLISYSRWMSGASTMGVMGVVGEGPWEAVGVTEKVLRKGAVGLDVRRSDVRRARVVVAGMEFSIL